MNRLKTFILTRILTRQAAPTVEGPAEIPAERVEVAAATSDAPLLTASYYPSWSSHSHPPESLDFSKFDILFYAFATPSSAYGLNWDEGSPAVLKRLVAAAKKAGQGTRVVLSVGGWGGCEHFSDIMTTSANRATFIAALKNAVNTYELDGVDIDWEYPNSPGAGQRYSPQDVPNLLAFFTSLRKSLGASKIISAAVPHVPWMGADDKPLKDLSMFTPQLTYVHIMNFDVWGASDSPGPNAPLADESGTSPKPSASATAAVKAWSDAGIPKNKILLGLPLYGYVSKSTKTVLIGNTGTKALASPNEDADKQEAIKETIIRSVTEDTAEMSPTALPGLDAAPKSPSHRPGEGYFLDGAHDRAPQKLAALIAAPPTPPEPADASPKSKKRWSLPVATAKAKLSVELTRKKTTEDTSRANGHGSPVVDISKAAGTSQEPPTESPVEIPKSPVSPELGTGDFGASFGQRISFSNILAKGALARDGDSYVATNGYTRAWDDCSSTPYLYNQSRSTVITYDDPQSLAAKAAFAKAQGLAGCLTWSLDQVRVKPRLYCNAALLMGVKDDGYILQNAIRTALGKSQ